MNGTVKMKRNCRGGVKMAIQNTTEEGKQKKQQNKQTINGWLIKKQHAGSRKSPMNGTYD